MGAVNSWRCSGQGGGALDQELDIECSSPVGIAFPPTSYWIRKKSLSGAEEHEPVHPHSCDGRKHVHQG